MKPKKRVILIIRDGWGYRKDSDHNAIAHASTPNTDKLMKSYQHVLINTSGEAVGLPNGFQGNSEVGHMAIGSGRIIFQSMDRINTSIKNNSFFKIPEFLRAIENCKEHNTRLHIIGLLQVEGVHAHKDHLFALLDLCKKQNFKDVYVHVVTDGRDAPVTDSIKHVKSLLKKFKEIGFGTIATLSGRYYTMDRNKRWERTKQAYDCIVNAECEEEFDDVLKQIETCHKNDETDEFIRPRKLKGYGGIKENDSFIFYNFRTDRTRQLTKAIVEKKFLGWKRQPLNLFFVAMTKFYSLMSAHVAFKEQKLSNLLGEVISRNNIRQLRISETEKYAHVTFFFNGQVEKPNKKEDMILIPSPHIKTYDLKPEMSAYKITGKLIKQITAEKYSFIVVNLVNGDMVGHTGIIPAIKKGITAVDGCVGRIVESCLEHGYTALIFADHGNAEDQTKKWRTSHTINPVPLILVSNDEKLKKCKLKKNKGLQDIAPTVLELMDIPKPKEMTGKSLIIH